MRYLFLSLILIFQLHLISAQEVITIPVVAHIVYSTNLQNISDQQVHSQIISLNRDFRRLNSDTSKTLSIFKSLAADGKIEFKLASIDPLGNQTNGITRTNTSHGPFGNNDIYFSSKGGFDVWDPSKYLNIWVCDLPPGIEGFAPAPGSESFKDGIVADYERFGTMGTAKAPYHLGRTATHEVGHWLGLKHIWGTSGDCSDDDGIADTPEQGTFSEGCNLTSTSCGNLNMTQNFMDYSVDSCMNLFTYGQRESMRNVLGTERRSVIENSNISLSAFSRSAMGTQFSFYPNPLEQSGRLTILVTPPQEINLKILDLNGSVIFSRRNTGIVGEMIVESMPVFGMYILQINGKHRMVYIK